MNEWYKLSIKDLLNKGLSLPKAYDEKYGDYEYTDNDLRYQNYDEFQEALLKILGDNPGDILLCGANQGLELSSLTDLDTIATDISERSLRNLNIENTHIPIFQGNIMYLPFKNNSFDSYIALRTIQSHNVKFENVIDESIRVTRPGGIILFSIPNGYIINGEIQKGMYDSSSDKFSVSKPYDLTDEIISNFADKGIDSLTNEIESEIFIYTYLPS